MDSTKGKELADESIKKRFGENLSKLRRMQGIMRKDLAKSLDISEVSVGAYENGKRQPNYEMLFKIADYFGITVDELLGHTKTDNSAAVADYRLKRAIKNLSTVGIVRRTNKDRYVLTIYNDKKFEFNAESEGMTVESFDLQRPDSLLFANAKSFIAFTEMIERRAAFSEKTFQTIFFEQDKRNFISIEELYTFAFLVGEKFEEIEGYDWANFIEDAFHEMTHHENK